MKTLNFKKYGLNVMDDVSRKYTLRMSRYLTQEERKDIRLLVPDTSPDWSAWKRKLESGEISTAIRRLERLKDF
jgi:hypothetical protein